MMQSQILLAGQEPFLAAEVSYHRETVTRGFPKHSHPHHWVPRRPHLRLPRPRRRPLAVA
jgi:hypothetical protein